MKSPCLFYVPIFLMLCLFLTCCKTFDISPYKCYYCNGNGRIICKKCNGVGTIMCPTCHQMGFVFCGACSQGIETYKDGNEVKKRTCSQCKGNYSRKCPWCDYGRKKCNECNGIHNNRLCDKCNGKGIAPYKIKEYERARTEYYQDRKK